MLLAVVAKNWGEDTSSRRSNRVRYWFGYLVLLALSLTSHGVSAATDCLVQTDIPQAQCQALVDLYTSTNGPGWTDAATNNWNVTNTPCSWTGVTCSSVPGNITQIDRSAKNLVGTLPTSLNVLTSLQYLYLFNNQLTGTIPDPLPASLLGLGLSSNQLTGTIPNPLPANLQYLSLDWNQLTGTIPDPLPASLQQLLLGYNQLTGTIPALPTSLLGLVLSGNQLTGPIPVWINTLTSLQHLNLGWNHLTGAIPDLSALTSLLYLDLSGNQLTGTIPALPASLQFLDLGGNQLTGPIPALPASLQRLRLYSNQLTAIPNLSALTSLQELWLSNNQLTGTIPALPANLQYLNLDNNQLTGSIPDLSATALVTPNVYLSCNRLTGETGTSATDRDPDWATTQCFPTPRYGSPPLPGSTLNIGTSVVGTPVTTDLILTEVGDAPLTVGLISLSGPNASDFTVNTSLFPVTIADGGVAVPVALTCTPAAAGLRTATLALTSNDPNYLNLTYSLTCTGEAPTTSMPVIQPQPTIPKYTSLLISFGGDGQGQVTTSDGFITCDNAGGTCTHTYNTGTSVTLTATAAEGSTFWAWGGNDDCEDGQVTLYNTRYCTAYFHAIKQTLTIIKVGEGTVTGPNVNCGTTCIEEFNTQTVVALTATPAAGWTFDGWTGNCDANGTVTLDADKTCTAEFSQVVVTPPPVVVEPPAVVTSPVTEPTVVTEPSVTEPVATVDPPATTPVTPSEPSTPTTPATTPEPTPVTTPEPSPVTTPVTVPDTTVIPPAEVVTEPSYESTFTGQIQTESGQVGRSLTIDTTERFKFVAWIQPDPRHVGKLADVHVVYRWYPNDDSRRLTVPAHVARGIVLQEQMEFTPIKGPIITPGGRFNVDLNYHLVDEDVEVTSPDVAILTLRPNRPPTKIHLSEKTMKVDAPDGTIIGTFTVDDPDKGDWFRCRLLYDGDRRFAMTSGNRLMRWGSFYMPEPEYTIVVRCSDISGGYLEQSFAIQMVP